MYYMYMYMYITVCITCIGICILLYVLHVYVYIYHDEATHQRFSSAYISHTSTVALCLCKHSHLFKTSMEQVGSSSSSGHLLSGFLELYP